MAVLTREQVAALLLKVGFTPAAAARLTAISQLESGYDSSVVNDNPSTGDYSVGLFQVNYAGNLYDSRTAAYGTPEQLAADPLEQAKAAYAISGGGTNFAPWSTNKSVTAEGLALANKAVVDASHDPNFAQSLASAGNPLINLPAVQAQLAQNASGAASADNSPINTPWGGILLSLDGVLNDTSSKPLAHIPGTSIDIPNPIAATAATGSVLLARGAIVTGGAILSIFGLLVLVKSLSGATGVNAIAGKVPGGTIAAAVI